VASAEFISPIEVKIKSSGKDVVSSGSCHTFDNKNLEIEIAGLRFIFEFQNDSEGQRIEKEPINNTCLKLKVYNFDNSLGTGTTSPIPLGAVNNRRLYMSFLVHTLSKESSKLFTYTFFLGEGVS